MRPKPCACFERVCFDGCADVHTASNGALRTRCDANEEVDQATHVVRLLDANEVLAFYDA